MSDGDPKQLIELQIKLQTTMFDKGRTYTNLVLAAGYAGYFGVWSFSRPFLSKKHSIWIAALVLVSLTVFVLFEVLLMFLVTRAQIKKALELQQLADAGTLELGMIQRYEAIERAVDGAVLKAMPIYRSSFVICVSTALAGAAILLTGLFWHLVHD